MRPMRNESPDNSSVEHRLRSERPMRQAPIGFTERVMSRIPSMPEIPMERKHTLFFPRFALSFAILALAAFGAFQFFQQDPGPAPLIANDTGDSGSELNFSIPPITSAQVQALTLKLDQPLEKELEHVISDTRQAIQFVASNFLPEK